MEVHMQAPSGKSTRRSLMSRCRHTSGAACGAEKQPYIRCRCPQAYIRRSLMSRCRRTLGANVYKHTSGVACGANAGRTSGMRIKVEEKYNRCSVLLASQVSCIAYIGVGWQHLINLYIIRAPSRGGCDCRPHTGCIVWEALKARNANLNLDAHSVTVKSEALRISQEVLTVWEALQQLTTQQFHTTCKKIEIEIEQLISSGDRNNSIIIRFEEQTCLITHSQEQPTCLIQCSPEAKMASQAPTFTQKI
eukprot:1161677-Pelagomonas_calceolata.AAC.2